MSNQKVTLSCGIVVDFTGKLDAPFNYIGSFADMLKRYKASKNPDIRNIAIIEIENRAITKKQTAPKPTLPYVAIRPITGFVSLYL